ERGDRAARCSVLPLGRAAGAAHRGAALPHALDPRRLRRRAGPAQVPRIAVGRPAGLLGRQSRPRGRVSLDGDRLEQAHCRGLAALDGGRRERWHARRRRDARRPRCGRRSRRRQSLVGHAVHAGASAPRFHLSGRAAGRARQGVVVPVLRGVRHAGVRGPVPAGAPLATRLAIPLSGFLDVLLRGLALCGQGLAVGGVFFGLLILRPAARADTRWAAAEPRTLLLIAAGAAVVVVAQGLSVSMQLGSLVSELDSSLSTALATSYFAASVARTLVCGLVIATAIGLHRRTPSLGAWLVLVGLSFLLPLGAAGTSHAAAPLRHRGPFLPPRAIHPPPA